MLYNGAILFDPAARRVTHGFFLENEIVKNIIEYGKKAGIAPFWFGLDPNDAEVVYYEQPSRECDIAFRASRDGDPRFRIRASLSEAEEIRTVELAYIGTKQELDSLYQWAAEAFGHRIHIHLSPDNYLKGYYFLELGHPRANKHDALLTWMSILGIEPEQITVFGDNLNDTGLFEAAKPGTRVAVGNARPELLEAADVIIPANDEDSVAEYIHARCVVS
jgi:hydroxymethylpyrimidine pyrophosphatase-like HAD family hydrolase